MATERQIESYELHRDACISNGIPQTMFYHRQKEGTLTPVGPQGLNTRYTQPGPRSTDNPTDAGVAVWATWDGLNLRGIGQDGGDTAAARMWMERFLVQWAAIDDSYNPMNVQDDDFMVNTNGVRFKLENPALSPDGSYWKAVAVVQR